MHSNDHPGTNDTNDDNGSGTDGGSSGGGDWTNITRRGYHKVKYGFETPLVVQYRKRGWGYNNNRSASSQQGGAPSRDIEYPSSVPTETALRILHRHANCFDTNSVKIWQRE